MTSRYGKFDIFSIQLCLSYQPIFGSVMWGFTYGNRWSVYIVKKSNFKTSVTYIEREWTVQKLDKFNYQIKNSMI